MKFLIPFSFLFLSLLVNAQTRYDVSSVAEYNMVQAQANAGDTIVWIPGVYTDINMSLNKDGLIVTAIPHGSVLFTGVSRAIISANDVTFAGFQYVGGTIGTLDVIRVFGSDVLITQVNIQNYTSHKYLRVYEESRRTTISYCNFENRLNLDDQNILSILVDNEPGFHKIQHCSFKRFDGFGGDMGIEPIRIGVSSQGNLDSRTLVEYCYFTRCNGDGEIISHKARQNVYRYNTFEDNPFSELVLRHGDEGIIYGNFFLDNRGGVRIREGSNHFIYNNYFEDIDDRAIWLMNDPADPLSDIHIYHNTIVNSDRVRLGSNGNNPPANVTIANNIFANPTGNLFSEDTESETWLGNIFFGDLGIDSPPTGLVNLDPQLAENPEGFLQPEANSPVIAAASAGYPEIPLYPGMDYDNELLLDLMQQSRPTSITNQAVGASEFSSTVNVQPHATELNTGPSYLFDNLVDYIAANKLQFFVGGVGENSPIFVSSNIDWIVTSSDSWISTDLLSGSGDGELIVMIDANPETVSRTGTLTITGGTQSVTININQDPGPVSVFENSKSEAQLFPNPTDGRVLLSNLPSEIQNSLIEVIRLDGRSVFSKEYQINNNELVLDLDKLVSGTYLLNLKFMNQNGTIYKELTRKFVRN